MNGDKVGTNKAKETMDKKPISIDTSRDNVRDDKDTGFEEFERNEVEEDEESMKKDDDNDSLELIEGKVSMFNAI